MMHARLKAQYNKFPELTRNNCSKNSTVHTYKLFNKYLNKCKYQNTYENNLELAESGVI